MRARTIGGPQRDPVAVANRRARAGRTGAVRKREDGVQPVTARAAARALGQASRRAGGGRGCCGDPGRDDPFRGRERRPRLPARREGHHEADHARGHSRGGFATKHHLRAECRGTAVTFCLSGGERHAQTRLPTRLESGALKRRGRGRPRLHPEGVAGEKSSSSRTAGRSLRRWGSGAVIPRRANEPRQRPFDREASRERNGIEWLVTCLTHNRAFATPYDTLDGSPHARLTFAGILIWWYGCRHDLGARSRV